MEEDLSISTFLGLVSQLKETKDCKVMLLFNDSKLDEKTRKQLDEYREKLVDIEIAYKPLLITNLQIVWQDGGPDSVKATFVRMGLNNIRVMQQVKRMLDTLGDEIRTAYSNVWDDFERQCVVLSVLHYSYGNILPLEELADFNRQALLFSDEEKSGKEKDKVEKLELLKRIGFEPQIYDRLICEFLRDGHANLEAYQSTLRKGDSEAYANQVQKEFMRLSRAYQDDFTKSQDEILKQMNAFLRAKGASLPLNLLDYAVKVMKEFAPKENYSAILDEVLERYAQLPELDRWIIGEISTETWKKLEEKHKSQQTHPSLDSLIRSLADHSGYNPSDVPKLAVYTAKDFENWLLSEGDVAWILRAFFRRFGAGDEPAQKVITEIQGALDQLAKISPMNARRVAIIRKEIPRPKQADDQLQ